MLILHITYNSSHITEIRNDGSKLFLGHDVQPFRVPRFIMFFVHFCEFLINMQLTVLNEKPI